jgi:hypothetical protein
MGPFKSGGRGSASAPLGLSVRDPIIVGKNGHAGSKGTRPM